MPSDRMQLLREAIEHGATLSDFISAYKHNRNGGAPRFEEAIIAKAREEHHVEGELEIDDTTICSGSDGPGDYVLAWVWVYFDKEK